MQGQQGGLGPILAMLMQGQGQMPGSSMPPGNPIGAGALPPQVMQALSAMHPQTGPTATPGGMPMMGGPQMGPQPGGPAMPAGGGGMPQGVMQSGMLQQLLAQYPQLLAALRGGQ